MAIVTVSEGKITGLQFMKITASIISPQARVEKYAHDKDIFRCRTIFTVKILMCSFGNTKIIMFTGSFQIQYYKQ